MKQTKLKERMSVDLFKKKVLIHRVKILRLFSIIFITDVGKGRKTRNIMKPCAFGGKCGHFGLFLELFNQKTMG